MPLYDIRNPCSHRRVIYDGIERGVRVQKNDDGTESRTPHQQKWVGIDPGEIKRNVELAPHIVEQLRNNIRKGIKDLIVDDAEPGAEVLQTEAPPVEKRPERVALRR